jgi:hypothetical protein
VVASCQIPHPCLRSGAAERACSSVGFSPPISSGLPQHQVGKLNIRDQEKKYIYKKARTQKHQNTLPLEACCPSVGCHPIPSLILREKQFPSAPPGICRPRLAQVQAQHLLSLAKLSMCLLLPLPGTDKIPDPLAAATTPEPSPILTPPRAGGVCGTRRSAEPDAFRYLHEALLRRAELKPACNFCEQDSENNTKDWPAAIHAWGQADTVFRPRFPQPRPALGSPETNACPERLNSCRPHLSPRQGPGLQSSDDKNLPPTAD